RRSRHGFDEKVQRHSFALLERRATFFVRPALSRYPTDPLSAACRAFVCLAKSKCCGVGPSCLNCVRSAAPCGDSAADSSSGRPVAFCGAIDAMTPKTKQQKERHLSPEVGKLSL